MDGVGRLPQSPPAHGLLHPRPAPAVRIVVGGTHGRWLKIPSFMCPLHSSWFGWSADNDNYRPRSASANGLKVLVSHPVQTTGDYSESIRDNEELHGQLHHHHSLDRLPP